MIFDIQVTTVFVGPGEPREINWRVEIFSRDGLLLADATEEYLGDAFHEAYTLATHGLAEETEQ